MNNKDMSWTFFQHWNNSISREDRPLKPRDYIWASEIGGAYLDRFLKMNAETPTNPPNMRSRRKFQAGHEWERNIRMLLSFAGIHKSSEEYFTHQYSGLLKVTGRADFVAGGTPDWAKARQLIKDYALLGNDTPTDDDFYMRIMNNFALAIGNKTLKTIILELKSCSSFMFDMYEATGKPNRHHELQLFHYLKSSGMDEGHIVYISKDDCRMIEFGVFNPSPIEDLYRADIEEMTKIFKLGKQPEKEPQVLFDENRGKFTKNWKIEYSNYLTKIYGYSEPESYRAMWDSKITAFNRALGRLVLSETGGKTPTGKPITLTAGNKEALAELEATFESYPAIIAKAKELAQKGLIVEGGEEI